MASVTLTMTDLPGGELEVVFTIDGMKTASTLKENTVAQNAAVLLSYWMKQHGLGKDSVPDLQSDAALEAWKAKHRPA